MSHDENTDARNEGLPDAPDRESVAAFTAFYRQYKGDAERIAGKRLRDTEAVADVVSEAFILLWNHWGELPSDRRMFFLRACLWRLQHASIRKGRREAIGSTDEEVVERADEKQDFAADGATRVLEEEARQMVIETLSSPFREAFELVGMQGLSYEEAAQQLGISLTLLNYRVSTARQRLRRRLGPYLYGQ